MVHHQVYVFLWSLLAGAIMAFVFDFFRLTRRKGNTKPILVYLEDIIYWIIVACIIIVSAFLTNNGDIRGFMFIGYIIGAVLYFMLLSNIFLSVCGGILDFIEGIFKGICGFFRKIVNNFKFKEKNVKS